MIWDIPILLAFIVYSISVGFIQRRKASKNLTEYFLAGRTLSGWQAGFSMSATQYAADTPLLVTGLVATAGIFSLWRLWVYALAFLLMGFVLGACWRRSRVLTDAEFTELRYEGKAASILRALKAVHLGTIVNCTVLAMVLLAATRIAEPFLIWHEWLPSSWIHPLAHCLERIDFSVTSLPASHPDIWIRSVDNLISILLILTFTTLYSTTGGLRSVVATDVVQFLIAMIATLLYAWIILDRIGGLGELNNRLISIYGTSIHQAIMNFGPAEWNDLTYVFIGVLAIQWFAQINSDGTGYLAQRTMACRSDQDAKLAAVIFSFAQVLIRSLIWLPIALGLLILYPAAYPTDSIQGVSETFRMTREATFAYGIRDLLPPGIRGLMLTGMLAALASTIDTHLNWGSSYWTNDIYKRFYLKELAKREDRPHELVWVARISNVGILLIALVIMANLNSIQEAWHLSLLFGSGLGVVFILRWLWERINVWSEVSAAAGSLILAPILLFAFPDLSEGIRLIWMTLLTTALMIAATLLTPPESQDRLKLFFERVNPPGFWAKTFLQCPQIDKNPFQRLKQGVLAVLLSSLSLFSLLIGIGNIIIGAELWVGLIFSIFGLILIPFWWSLSFQQ